MPLMMSILIRPMIVKMMMMMMMMMTCKVSNVHLLFTLEKELQEKNLELCLLEETTFQILLYLGFACSMLGKSTKTFLPNAGAKIVMNLIVESEKITQKLNKFNMIIGFYPTSIPNFDHSP